MSVSVRIAGNTAGAGATQINNVTNHLAPASELEIRQACLKALRCADSLKVKTRLKQAKDELLYDSFKWILSDEQYRQWQDGKDIGLLWIKGGAGKGKTMMSIGLVEELRRHQSPLAVVIYFFCQNADSSLNTVAAIVKGLIFRLVGERPAAFQALLTKWNIPNASFEEDMSRWQNLWDIFLEMLAGCQSRGDTVFIVVDAFDECLGNDMSEFLQAIVRTGLHAPGVMKWLLTSRPLQAAENYLITSANRLHVSFELNSQQIETGIGFYIEEQVRRLILQQKVDASTRDALIETISTKANGTFLWVNHLCRELQHVQPGQAMSVVMATSPDLRDLYAAAYNGYQVGVTTQGTRCMNMLQVLMLAYRPLTVTELSEILDLDDGEAGTKVLINGCSQFVTLRHDDDNTQYVEFVHQSARDFLAELSDFVLDQALSVGQATMATRCLSILNGLRTHSFRHLRPDLTGSELVKARSQSLTALNYAALSWALHLQEISEQERLVSLLCDGKQVHLFMRNNFLEWLEYLVSLDQLHQASRTLDILLNMLSKIDVASNTGIGDHIRGAELTTSTLPTQSVSMLLCLLQDSRRFLTRYHTMIDEHPLQVYGLAIIFSPQSSIIKKNNINQVPTWLQSTPEVDPDWSTLQQTLAGHLGVVISVAFSPDGQLIASGSVDKTVKVWSIATGQVQTLIGHSKMVNSVAFSPDGQLIASGSDDKTVKVWSIATGQVQTLIGHSKMVNSVAFSPDGLLIASGSHDKTIKVWSTVTGQVRQTLTGHSYCVNSVVFSPDGQLIASGSDDWTITVWSTATGQIQQTFVDSHHKIISVAFSPDGQLLTSGSAVGFTKVWSRATGQVQQKLWDLSNSVAFSPDGQMLAASSSDETVRVWSIATGQVQQTLTGHSERVNSVAFSPDGQLIASGSIDQTVKVWSTAIGQVQQTLTSHLLRVNSVAFSLDGQLIASGSDDKTVKIWSTVTGQMQQTLTGHLLSVNSVAFSPDGQLIASGSVDMTIKVWSTATGQVQQTLGGHTVGVKSVVFSPDGQLIASGSIDQTVKVWLIATGQVRTLIGHSNTVNSVAFSPDGLLIASGSDDKTVKVWSTVTGQVQQQTLTSHSKMVNSVAFSPDGQLIASGSSDKTVKVWSLSSRLVHRIFGDKIIGTPMKWRVSQSIECQDSISYLRFTEDNGRLITNAGCLTVSTSQVSQEQPLQSSDTEQLSYINGWIAYGSTRLLCVPPEYTVSHWDVQRDVIVLCCWSGRVLCFRIDKTLLLAEKEGKSIPRNDDPIPRNNN